MSQKYTYIHHLFLPVLKHPPHAILLAFVRRMKPKKLVDTYCEMHEMTQELAEAEVATRIDSQDSAYEQLTADAEDALESSDSR